MSSAKMNLMDVAYRRL